MIMLGKTPRTLSALGLAAVLGLGAALLPLVPTGAQAEPDNPFRKDRRDRDRDAPPPDRDRQDVRPDNARSDRAPDQDKAREEMRKAMEQLRQAQEKLREATQKLGDPDGRRAFMFRFGQPGAPNNFEIRLPFDGRGDMAKAMVKRLEEEIQTRTKDLMEAKEKQAKVAKDTSKDSKAEAERMAAHIQLAEAELQTKKAQLNEMKLRVELAPKLTPPRPDRQPGERRGFRRSAPDDRAGRPGNPPGDNRRGQDLEKKLDELMREVERLRKDIKDKPRP